MNELLRTALERLPHGPEFRFVDRLIALEPGRTGIGEYTVRGDEPFLHGHFPGAPMMPGVLMIEAAAQLAGVVAQSDPQIVPMPGLKLTAVRAAKILGGAVPGDVIRLEAWVIARMANLVQAEVTATVNGKVVFRAELTLSGERPAD